MDVTINVGGLIGIIIGCLLVGGVAGFFGARFLVQRELKKNPPINEKMIRAMFLSMGRKPSEAQIAMTMRAMRDANGQGSGKRKKK